MRSVATVILVLLAAQLASTATVEYYFNITWTQANPDGQFSRRTMGINGTWPPPPIVCNRGDRVIVHAYNGLGDQSTSIHFHGLFQNGTAYHDGPAGVTQCPIGPGHKITYNFTVDQPGTYWYHAHQKIQYPDGLRAPFIVHDSKDPHRDKYDEEIVLALSDWYHAEMTVLHKQFLSLSNPTGAEPVPNSALINEQQDLSLKIEPGKTYLVRIINMAAFAAQYIWFEDHTMRIVEVDGVYTEEAEAERIYLTAAQRYSVLITAKNETDKNYAFVGSMDQDLFDAVPDGLNPNVTGWLMYDEKLELPPPLEVDNFDHFDDFELVPTDGEKLFENPTQSIQLNVMMDNLGDGANYAFFNGITYVRPKVPTLYTALSTGEDAINPLVYGRDTNPFVLGYNEVIEIVLNNMDPGKHPFHLHGHNFQVVGRSDEEAGSYDPAVPYDMPEIPMRRDVILVRPNGNLILRFRSDNPGVWLFHCHIEWHVDSGLITTFVSAPLEMQKTYEIPDDHFELCKAQSLPIAGNAAANTVNFTDLTGQNLSPAPLPAGFTTKGYVAMVFSCLSAVLGLGFIVWYGIADLPKSQ